MRTLPLLLLLLARAAVADETLATPTEPGTLAAGRLAVELGGGIGAGPPPALGGRLTLGLGRVDVSAGAGWIPGICLFDSCDPGFAVGGAGLGALLYRFPGGRTTLGARAGFDGTFDNERNLRMISGGVQLTTGTERHRFSVELMTLHYHEDIATDDNGLFVGARAGYTLIARHIGLTLSLGALVNPETGKSLPVGGLYVFFD